MRNMTLSYVRHDVSMCQAWSTARACSGVNVCTTEMLACRLFAETHQSDLLACRWRQMCVCVSWFLYQWWHPFLVVFTSLLPPPPPLSLLVTQREWWMHMSFYLHFKKKGEKRQSERTTGERGAGICESITNLPINTYTQSCPPCLTDCLLGCNNGGGGGNFSNVKRLGRNSIRTQKRLFFGVSSFLPYPCQILETHELFPRTYFTH